MPKFKRGDLIIYKNKIDKDYYIVSGVLEDNSSYPCRYLLRQFGTLLSAEPVEIIDKEFIKVGVITDKGLI